MGDGRLYLFTGPAIAVIVSAAFFATWLHQRHRRYILLFAAGFFLYALAVLSQLLQIPRGDGSNALASGLLYTACILCVIEGALSRGGVRARPYAVYVVAAVVMVLVFYFYYVDRRLIVRIYAQNFGYGLMLLLGIWQIRHARHGGLIDRIFFWTLLVFGLHFFVRTILTVPLSGRIATFEQLRASGLDQAALAEIFRSSAFWQVLNFTGLMFSFLIAVVLLVTVAIDIIEDFRREGSVDTLTGLANRRGFDHRAAALVQEEALYPFCVVYGDLDHFKAINDTFGHGAGDRVLQAFARILVAELRQRDVAARFGGEEFVVLLCGAGRQGGFRFAERVRQALEATPLADAGGPITVTCSFGVAERRGGEVLHDLIHRADRMVYAAKRSGRNCTRVDEDVALDAAGAVSPPIEGV